MLVLSYLIRIVGCLSVWFVLSLIEVVSFPAQDDCAHNRYERIDEEKEDDLWK
jgi:hypothetical protein